MHTIPFTAPPNFRWLFVKDFIYFPSDRTIRAIYYGSDSFCILVRSDEDVIG